MSKRKNVHYDELPGMLYDYANDRGLDFSQYSVYNMRLMDGGYCVLDVWTTSRYWVMTTDYHAMNPQKKIVERGGEKGFLPVTNQQLIAWLDKFFFAPYS